MNLKSKINEIKSEPNVGSNEKEIRIVAGAIILLAAVSTTSLLLLVVSVYFLTTAYLQWCPIYNKLGKSTCEEGENVGTAEQNIRYAVGGGVIIAAAVYGSVILLTIGAIIAATGHVRWCPAYYNLDKNTCVTEE